MTLLAEIVQAAVDSSIDITTVLRKARILAARLKNKGFEQWIDRELNGYPHDKSVLPAYRILAVHAKAHLLFGWHQLPRATVMAGMIPEVFRDLATTAYLFDSISHYASLVSSQGDTMQSLWPQEIAVKYGGSGYNEAQCISAWQEIGKASVVAVIETVRNKLLDFALEIEAANPDAGESSPNSEPVAAEKVQQLVNNYFGSVGNIAQHSREFNQTATVTIQPHDLSKLVKELTNHFDELKLEVRQRQKAEAQLATLQAQLSDDEPDPIIVNQAGRTLRSIIEGAIGSLLANAVQPHVWQWIHNALIQFK